MALHTRLTVGLLASLCAVSTIAIGCTANKEATPAEKQSVSKAQEEAYRKQQGGGGTAAPTR